SELDEGRSEFRQCRRQPLAGATPGAAAWARQHPTDEQDRRCQAGALDERGQWLERAMALQRARDRQQAKDVAQRPQHGSIGQMRQAEWSAAMPPVKLRNMTCSRPCSAMSRASSSCGGNRRMLSTRYW